MPKIVDKESKRKQIAAVAMELFAQKGFDRTPIREVTSKAGMGKGTFYDYFIDKEDLLGEIVEVMFTEWTELIASKLKGSEDPLLQLAALLKEGARLGDEFKQLMILYVDIWRRAVRKKGSRKFNRRFQMFLLDSKKSVSEIIERAKMQGMIREEVDSDGIATILIALVDGLCLHYMVLKSEVQMDRISETFLDTLLHGLK
jgi:AcrR family transcriptional regulator